MHITKRIIVSQGNRKSDHHKYTMCVPQYVQFFGSTQIYKRTKTQQSVLGEAV